ncbi:gametocyte-specific factor 1 [Amyelois transitella]|uniref:gametocyte-specific factor 1 n=1 Tax=Amyelois transitella TaxID=680683 RepID=UPI00067D8251|nr:gametocyte-specific factor 1 [Amyelois transitella]
MAEPNPHKLITCPYEMSHQVEHYRMHIHLQKCRKQHRDCNKVSCPFDSTHVVNEVELDFHVTVCPKRLMFDREVYIMDDYYQPAAAAPAAPTVVPCEENWDEEATTSYDPNQAKKGSHVITKIKGATPSERRKARMEGVKNFRPLEN